MNDNDDHDKDGSNEDGDKDQMIQTFLLIPSYNYE